MPACWVACAACNGCAVLYGLINDLMHGRLRAAPLLTSTIVELVWASGFAVIQAALLLPFVWLFVRRRDPLDVRLRLVVFGSGVGMLVAVATPVGVIPAGPLGLILVSIALWAFLPAVFLDAGCCYKCGYDLTGNVSGVCPECGRPIQSESTIENRQSTILP